MIQYFCENNCFIKTLVLKKMYGHISQVYPTVAKMILIENIAKRNCSLLQRIITCKYCQVDLNEEVNKKSLICITTKNVKKYHQRHTFTCRGLIHIQLIRIMHNLMITFIWLK